MDISKYIGIEYDHPRSNCWTLVLNFLHKELGIMTPKYDFDGKIKDADSMFIKHLPDWQPIESPQRGALVIFNLGGKPLHCGVALNEHTFLHCLQGRNSCIERFNSPLWAKRIAGYYLWRS